jgi:SAM-dependent methyltransferase
VWSRKGSEISVSEPLDGDTLHVLMELGGYHSPTSTLSLSDHEVHFRYVVDSLGIGPADSVYDVGCGAGALLYWLRDKCAQVGGADFAASLIAHARTALPPGSDLEVREASTIDTEPQYDVVLSNGVFIYFPTAAYAEEVLERMIAKATRAVGVLDVNDAELEADSREARAAAQGVRAADYAGLDQLYLRREFFEEAAARHGLTCRIEASPMPNSVNAKFRYHVTMLRP